MAESKLARLYPSAEAMRLRVGWKASIEAVPSFEAPPYYPAELVDFIFGDEVNLITIAGEPPEEKRGA